MALRFEPVGSGPINTVPYIPADLIEYTLVTSEPAATSCITATILRQEIAYDIFILRYLVFKVQAPTQVNVIADRDHHIANFVLGSSLLSSFTPGLDRDYKDGQYQIIYIPASSHQLVMAPGIYRFLQLELTTTGVADFVGPLREKSPQITDGVDGPPGWYANASIPIETAGRTAIDTILSNSIENAAGKLHIEAAAKLLLGLTLAGIEQYSQKEIPLRSRDKELLERIKTHILTSLDMKVTIAEICKNFKVKRSWLQMAYKQMYQVNIHDYIQMEKIKHAKALLLKGEPVSTVAENVGYLNVSHFIRAFKKITGKTPTAFKRQPH